MGGVGYQPCRIARPPGIFFSRNGGSDYAADCVNDLADGITVPDTEVENVRRTPVQQMPQSADMGRLPSR